MMTTKCQNIFTEKMLCLQHFHNKSQVVGCYRLLLVGKKVISLISLNYIQ